MTRTPTRKGFLILASTSHSTSLPTISSVQRLPGMRSNGLNNGAGATALFEFAAKLGFGAATLTPGAHPASYFHWSHPSTWPDGLRDLATKLNIEADTATTRYNEMNKALNQRALDLASPKGTPSFSIPTPSSHVTS